MTHNITKEDYIKNPCGVCSTAFWKNERFVKPANVSIIHENDYDPLTVSGRITKYFRLIHNLKEISNPILAENYAFRNVDIPNEKNVVSHIINCCYSDMDVSGKTVDEWAKHKVFDKDLWIFIVDETASKPVALGIADFDPKINEGSLEWIQVLPEYRAQGLGLALVNALLCRLKRKADFVTVSGQVDNATRPEALYRKCGFTGDDIWYVIYV